ncbi:YncE family protein [Chloroflexota bacterium]
MQARATSEVIKAPLQASDGSPLGTYAVGSVPYGICFDGANIWVANYGSNDVTKLQASDGSVLGTYAVGTFPWGICFDGANIWVVNQHPNDVTKL